MILSCCPSNSETDFSIGARNSFLPTLEDLNLHLLVHLKSAVIQFDYCVSCLRVLR